MFRSKSITFKSLSSFLCALLMLNIATPLNLVAMQSDTQIPMQDVTQGGKSVAQAAAPAGIVPTDMIDPSSAISPWWLGIPTFFAFAFMSALIAVIIKWKTTDCDNCTDINETLCNDTLPQCFELVTTFNDCVLKPLCFANQTNS